MKTRRTFLTGVAAGGAAVLLAHHVDAVEAAPAPTPTASPTPSPASLASAAQMRTFDAHLSDADLTTIASGIDDANKAGARLNPKGRFLHNWDEPVTHFAAGSNEERA